VKISVVIPSSNGARFLVPCLEALRKTRIGAGDALEPIVVDNGSSDGTASLLAQYPEVKALVFPKPLGFARANNAAREIATGDVVCFLNNDTRVEPGWMERPLQIFARDARVTGVGSKLLFMHEYVPVRFSLPQGTRIRIGSVFRGPLDEKVRRSSGACNGWIRDQGTVYVPLPVPQIDPPLATVPVLQLLESDGSLRGAAVSTADGTAHRIERLPAIVPIELPARTVRLIQNAGNFLNERCEGGDVGSGEEDQPGRYATEEIVPAICGAEMSVRREALDAAGWFPDYYRVYYEDVDLCLRLRSRGGLLVFCPSSVVNHYHTGTNREWSPRFVENVARSSFLFASRYGSARQITRSIQDRLGHARNELLHGRGWTAAAGTRGFLSALPALRKTFALRIQDSLRSTRIPAPALLAAGRSPYQQPR